MQYRLPISSDSIPTPEYAKVNSEDILIDNIWRMGTAPTHEWTRNSTGNSLRDYIVHMIEQKQLYHPRNFSGRRGGGSII